GSNPTILLERPPMLGESVQDCARALRSGQWQGQRANAFPRTFESTGSWYGAQLGVELANCVMEVFQAFDQLQQMRQQEAQWQEEQMNWRYQGLDGALGRLSSILAACARTRESLLRRMRQAAHSVPARIDSLSQGEYSGGSVPMSGDYSPNFAIPELSGRC
ncbi:unnamed protein product, partial [Effrenium voratum]